MVKHYKSIHIIMTYEIASIQNVTKMICIVM